MGDTTANRHGMTLITIRNDVGGYVLAGILFGTARDANVAVAAGERANRQHAISQCTMQNLHDAPTHRFVVSQIIDITSPNLGCRTATAASLPPGLLPAPSAAGDNFRHDRHGHPDVRIVSRPEPIRLQEQPAKRRPPSLVPPRLLAVNVSQGGAGLRSRLADEARREPRQVIHRHGRVEQYGAVVMRVVGDRRRRGGRGRVADLVAFEQRPGRRPAVGIAAYIVQVELRLGTARYGLGFVPPRGGDDVRRLPPRLARSHDRRIGCRRPGGGRCDAPSSVLAQPIALAPKLHERRERLDAPGPFPDGLRPVQVRQYHREGGGRERVVSPEEAALERPNLEQQERFVERRRGRYYRDVVVRSRGRCRRGGERRDGGVDETRGG
mmetsp:Transcript_3327/g.8467  ORF Transcript_3327/g.8467 Transcript_3327/m.8467 type:complete len:382 (-) Transcript_3327:1485-2630(-)